MANTIKIKSLASTGKGVATVEKNGYNIPYFIPYAVPEDVISIKNIKQNKKYVEADIDEIIEPSPHRIEPNCPYFTICGGCDFLHIDYNEQIKQKKQMISHILTRNKIGFDNIQTLSMEDSYNYRYKIKLFLEPVNGTLKCGFQEKGTNTLIAIESPCRIINEKLNSIIIKINKANIKSDDRYIANVIVDKNDKVIFFTKHKRDYLESLLADDVTFVTKDDKIQPLNYKYEVDGKTTTLLYSPMGFVQANIKLNEQMVNFVYKAIKSIDCNKNLLIDLYAGNGNLSIPLSPLFKRIVAVEGNSVSANHFEENKRQNVIKNIVVKRKDVNKFSERPIICDALILDPPREGCQKEAIDKFASWKSKIIVYISCDITQSVKDLKQLVKQHNYKITDVAFIDMFAHTKHSEVITVLHKD